MAFARALDLSPLPAIPSSLDQPSHHPWFSQNSEDPVSYSNFGLTSGEPGFGTDNAHSELCSGSILPPITSTTSGGSNDFVSHPAPCATNDQTGDNTSNDASFHPLGHDQNYLNTNNIADGQSFIGFDNVNLPCNDQPSDANTYINNLSNTTPTSPFIEPEGYHGPYLDDLFSSFLPEYKRTDIPRNTPYISTSPRRYALRQGGFGGRYTHPPSFNNPSPDTHSIQFFTDPTTFNHTPINPSNVFQSTGTAPPLQRLPTLSIANTFPQLPAPINYTPSYNNLTRDAYSGVKPTTYYDAPTIRRNIVQGARTPGPPLNIASIPEYLPSHSATYGANYISQPSGPGPMLSLPNPYYSIPLEQQLSSAIHPNGSSRNGATSLTNTNALTLTAAQSGVDYQHSNSNTLISKTGHTTFANMSNHWEPSTSEASSAEVGSHRHTYPALYGTQSYACYPPDNGVQPPSDGIQIGPLASRSHPPPHTFLNPVLAPNPTTDPIPARKQPSRQAGQKRKRGVQLAPDPNLWTKTPQNRYACKYVGPSAPTGCKSVLRTLRNLGRHMREVHALQEASMDVADNERVALKGMPDALRLVQIACPYEDHDLEKCRYYKDNGRRWEEETMNRKDKLLRAHVLSYHDDPAELRRIDGVSRATKRRRQA